ncbi:MAG: S41 family peptidase [Patescibacteria group bacterium]|jgi:carboxyl-terminal processing protease
MNLEAENIPVKKDKKRERHSLFAFFVGVGIVVGFIFGFYSGQSIPNSQNVLDSLKPLAQLEPKGEAVYNSIIDRLQNQYIGQPVDNQKLFYGAMQGIVKSLNDPYSAFLTPEAAKSFKQDMDLSIEGIGAEIGFKEKQLAIISPLPDSPAEKAGLKAGDLLLTVDDVDVTDFTLDEVIQKIRGQAGTKVKIQVSRAGEVQIFEIKREKITVSSVNYRILNNIAIIELVSFNEETLPKLDNVIQEILLKKPKGIILDLRNNPGGLLESGIEVTGEFIGKEIVVKEKDSKGLEKSDSATRSARIPNLPLVVIVNEGSASASEIVAGALQDYKRATLVGTKTFGKGSVQTLEDLADGSQLKLTVAKWYTPKGRSISDVGITPDIVVENPTKSGDENDTQLQKALELLK